MPDELDVTDYVDLAAGAWWAERVQPESGTPWSDAPEVVKFHIREIMLNPVTVVLEAYKKNHPGKEDKSWLDVL